MGRMCTLKFITIKRTKIPMAKYTKKRILGSFTLKYENTIKKTTSCITSPMNLSFVANTSAVSTAPDWNMPR